MGDMGDFYRDVNQARQEKRADNRQKSPAILREKGISFVERNAGAHLIVTVGEEIIDFWPGTGKWISRKKGGSRGRGVFMLTHYVKDQEKSAAIGVDRSHEECVGCVKEYDSPPTCKGHVAGPSTCPQFAAKRATGDRLP